MMLGMIFQITDDLLDYFIEAKMTGKNIGDDFAEGKVTLPIIFLARKLPIEEKEKLVKLIAVQERTIKDFEWVNNLLSQFNIKSEIINYLQEFRISANKFLEEINIENESKENLRLLVEFAVDRSY